jgi:hypothetical protein
MVVPLGGVVQRHDSQKSETNEHRTLGAAGHRLQTYNQSLGVTGARGRLGSNCVGSAQLATIERACSHPAGVRSEGAGSVDLQNVVFVVVVGAS